MKQTGENKNSVSDEPSDKLQYIFFKGYFKSVEKFIKASEEQLEFETQDELRETPLMVAVRAGISNIETIQVIIELGGRCITLQLFMMNNYYSSIIFPKHKAKSSPGCYQVYKIHVSI